MYLTRTQRDALQSAAAEGTKAIDAVITQLRTENPAAFHSNTTLINRAFLLEPAQDIPCRIVRRDSVNAS